jgi:hypothetical protein
LENICRRQADAIWLSASDKAQISDAANQLDHLLATYDSARDAMGVGSRRVLAIHPLGLEFVVNDDDRKVTVVDIWLIKNE